jgi:hypothetical protein
MKGEDFLPWGVPEIPGTVFCGDNYLKDLAQVIMLIEELSLFCARQRKGRRALGKMHFMQGVVPWVDLCIGKANTRNNVHARRRCGVNERAYERMKEDGAWHERRRISQIFSINMCDIPN